LTSAVSLPACWIVCMFIPAAAWSLVLARRTLFGACEEMSFCVYN
jgi:hypothetical protein